jgi:hypothetical protein
MKRSSTEIAVIHFNPLELFPPITNLLDYLGKNTAKKIIVLSTQCRRERMLEPYKSKVQNITIKRTPGIVPASHFRIFNYSYFYLYTLFILMKDKPESVLYYETISSWPALMYKKLRGNKVKIFVHHHEYSSPEEYANSMRLVKALHKIESKMYTTDFEWISQTNEIRLNKFIEDQKAAFPQATLAYIHKESNGKALKLYHVIPNYPPRFWINKQAVFGNNNKIRLIYVGSLGYETMYLKELVEWVVLNQGKFTLDFYSHNVEEKAARFLKTIKSESVRFRGSCNYDELPGVLKNYDVGLVIYKPISENWIQNAPNKVFEYLACGLDVWFSESMTYTLLLKRENTYPKVIPVNFGELNSFDYKKALNHKGLVYKESEFFYENVYRELNESL